MARFVAANRRFGKTHEYLKRASRAKLDAGFAAHLEANVSILADNAPVNQEARRVVVFEADPMEVAAKTPIMGEDVVVEPEILHHPSSWHRRVRSEWLPFSVGAEAANAGSGSTLTIDVVSETGPVEGCSMTLYLRGWQGSSLVESVTNASGRATFSFASSWTPTALVVVPAGMFWTEVRRGPQDGATVQLRALPLDGPLGWWHRIVGVGVENPNLGAGIRVGVIDTGIRPNAQLDHIHDVGAFLDGAHDPAGGRDVDSHGSHVCGTIGARPANGSGHYAGIAPGVELYSARVFPAGGGANQGDIANAIDHLALESLVDLINMSLGASQPSEIEKDAILAARQEGTLCICAAGNSNGGVEWPARFAEAVAVSALGLEGWGPEGTLPSTRYPNLADRYGHSGLYLANFSCYGPEIDCCAPGVGIISTVPERFGLSAPCGGMDGTSMASPTACGALAVSLSSDPVYAALARDGGRAEHAYRRLRDQARDIGLAAGYQGRGVVRAL